MKKILMLLLLLGISSCKQNDDNDIIKIVGSDSIIHNFINADMTYNTDIYNCTGYFDDEYKRSAVLMCNKK